MKALYVVLQGLDLYCSFKNLHILRAIRNFIIIILLRFVWRNLRALINRTGTEFPESGASNPIIFSKDEHTTGTKFP